MVFLDMLRPNLLGLYNSLIKENSLDEELRLIGGELFINCFTPAPDSARSLACLWSGEYPLKNGCNTRIKYPKFFLDYRKENLLSFLRKEGFKFNFFISPYELKLGEHPLEIKRDEFHDSNLGLEAFFKKASFPEKSFTFISLPDFHWALDDYGYSDKGVAVGHKKICSSLKIIRKNLDLDKFDIVVFFSDHGMKLKKEMKKEPRYKLLNRDRTNILLLLRFGGDNGLKKNDKLCSIMDIYPAIYYMISGKRQKEHMAGSPILGEKEYDFLVIEDHMNFSVQINQMIGIWAVIKKDGIYYRTLENYYFDNKENFRQSPQELDRLISSKSLFFEEHIKEKEVLNYYGSPLFSTTPFYTDGSKRRNNFFLKKIKMLKKTIAKSAIRLMEYFKGIVA